MQDIDNDSVTQRARALLDRLNEKAPFPYAEGRLEAVPGVWIRSALTSIATKPDRCYTDPPCA